MTVTRERGRNVQECVPRRESGPHSHLESRNFPRIAAVDIDFNLPVAVHGEEQPLRAVASIRQWLRNDFRRCHAMLPHHRHDTDRLNGSGLHSFAVFDGDDGRVFSDTAFFERQGHIVTQRLHGRWSLCCAPGEEQQRDQQERRQSANYG